MAKKPTPAPAPDSSAATPTSPVGTDSSTSSWPATEVAVSEAGDPGSSDKPGSIALDNQVAATSAPAQEADTTLEQASSPSPPIVDVGTPAETPAQTPDEQDNKGELQTPISLTWSRSKLPVSDDEREAGGAGAEPDKAIPHAHDGGDEEVVARAASPKTTLNDPADDTAKADGEDDVPTPTAPSAPSRPAFVVTRPTLSGVNEIVSISQPSTPSASSVKSDADTPTDTLKPAIQIKTFLPETKQFFTSPTTTNAVPNSVISPRTSAFFSSDFTVGVRSPPHPGGAFIMELASDAEVEVDIRRATRTKVSIDKPFTRAPVRPEQVDDARASRPSSKSRSHSPRHRDDQDDREQHDARATSSRHSLHSRRRAAIPRSQNLSDTDSLSDLESPHIPFVQGRTVVSSAVPFLVRPESLRQPARRVAYERSHKAGHEAERDLHHRRAESRKEELRSRERARDADHRREERHREERRDEERRREKHAREDPARHERQSRRDERPRDHSKPALVRLLDAVREALGHDPAAYYALKGLLAEHEDRIRSASMRENRRHERDERDQRRSEAPRDVHDERRRHEREKREKHIPVQLGRMTRSSGSETEVEPVEKAGRKLGAGAKASRADDLASTKLRKPHFGAADPPRRQSPTPPCYPPHLASSRSNRSNDSPIELIRPVPVYPHQRESDSKETKREQYSPRPAQTLTLAQAAKLALGLGDERQAEQLRQSGLSGRDKVSKLERNSDKTRARWDEAEREPGARDQDQDQGKEERRRHSFDSVVDYKPGATKSAATASSGSKGKSNDASRKHGVDKSDKLDHRRRQKAARPERDLSAEEALRFSIFEVRVPQAESRSPAPPINVDIDEHRSHKLKHKGNGRAREPLYESPTTHRPPRTASYFDRGQPRSTASGDRYALERERGDSLSFDFDDFA